MIDWDRVIELRSEIGEADFLAILELFLDEIETITFRLASNDAAAMEVDLHFLNGCARNLGFRAMALLCEELEALVIAGRASEVRIEQVLDIYAHSKQMFVHTLATFQNEHLPSGYGGAGPPVQIRNSAKI